MDLATFAAGCFWGVEAAFQQVPGVIATRVGYTGGKLPNPTYQDVCSDTTGHAEAIQIEFDPDLVSYRQLLELFFSLHDPTSMDRQGPDSGSQYRSVIFYHSEQQKKEAELVIKELDHSGRYQQHVVTLVIAAGPFWQAEEEHQSYYLKMGRRYGNI